MLFIGSRLTLAAPKWAYTHTVTSSGIVAIVAHRNINQSTIMLQRVCERINNVRKSIEIESLAGLMTIPIINIKFRIIVYI